MTQIPQDSVLRRHYLTELKNNESITEYKFNSSILILPIIAFVLLLFFII
jgi:hypothetical protein